MMRDGRRRWYRRSTVPATKEERRQKRALSLYCTLSSESRESSEADEENINIASRGKQMRKTLILRVELGGWAGEGGGQRIHHSAWCPAGRSCRRCLRPRRGSRAGVLCVLRLMMKPRTSENVPLPKTMRILTPMVVAVVDVLQAEEW